MRARFRFTLGTNADTILDGYFGFADLVKRARSNPERAQLACRPLGSTSLWPALSELAAELGSGSWPRTSRTHFFKFMREYHAALSHKISYGFPFPWTTAWLAMHTPGQPEHGPPLATAKHTFSANDLDKARRSLVPGKSGMVLLLAVPQAA